jgi:tetratricopeptide (TPR) repeat protein
MILIILFLFFLSVAPVYAIDIKQGATAPDFSLYSVDGKVVSLSEYRDRVVVLIYWMAGLDRSHLALNDGQDIYMRYKDKDVQVLGLTAGTEDFEVVSQILRDLAIDFPVLKDSNRQVFGDYGIRVYPSTIIINKSGKVAYTLPGHVLTYKIALEGHVRSILGEIDEKEIEEMVSPHIKHIDKSVLKAHRKYKLALRFTEERLYEQSMVAVKQSIEAKPDFSKSHILSGFLYLEEKEADKALEDFNEAIKLEPLSHDAKTGLGGALILKGDIDRALEILTDATVANPYPQRTYYELGKAYEIKGEKDKALEMYKKAIEKIINNKFLPSSKFKCE